MASEYASIDLSPDSELLKLAEEVQRTNRPRILKREGEELAIISPLRGVRRHPLLRKKSPADMGAFWSSFGSWKDIDTDKLKEDIYESRRISTKPRPDL